MLTPEQMKQKAMEVMEEGSYCPQSVLVAGLAKMGIDNPELVKAMAGFGGGIAGTGRVCGLLLSSLAVISIILGKDDYRDEKDPRLIKLGYLMEEAFVDLTAEFGSINCRDIAKVDWTDPKQFEYHFKSPESRRSICIELAGKTAKALGELLEWENLTPKN